MTGLMLWNGACAALAVGFGVKVVHTSRKLWSEIRE